MPSSLHALRPQKVQFLSDKDRIDPLNNQAIRQKTVECSPRPTHFLWLFLP